VSETDDGQYHVWDQFWNPLVPDTDEEITDSVGTDRRAVADEAISVTPLCLGHLTSDRSEVARLVDRYYTGRRND